MKNSRLWTFRKASEGDEPRLDRCDDVAYLLTALFDNEASEEEARRARLHLLACQRCANLFASWNQSRLLLREAPAPAPPPTLLWRVLLACRLASMAGLKASIEEQPRRAPEPSAEMPPSALHANILAATVGRARAATPIIRRRPLWHPYRWPAFASPAMALWLVFLNTAPRFQPVNTAVVPAPEISLTAADSKPNSAASTLRTSARSRAPRPVTAAVETEPVKNAAPVRRLEQIEKRVEQEPEPRRVSAQVHEEQPEEVVEPVMVPEATASRALSERAARVAASPRALRPASLAVESIETPHSARAPFRPLAKAAIVRWARPTSSLRASTPDEPVSTPLVLASTSDSDNRLDEMQNTVQDFRALFASDVNVDDAPDGSS